MNYKFRLKGGTGSGFHGHRGRPGLEGGSLPRGTESSVIDSDYSDDPNNYVSRFPEVKTEFESATDLKDLSKIKNKYVKASDAGSTLPDGAWMYFHKKMVERIKSSVYSPRSAEESRADRILHITNSEGKVTSRKW